MTGLWVSPDRWTCPACGETEVPRAADGIPMQEAIARAQRKHAARHDKERRALRNGPRVGAR